MHRSSMLRSKALLRRQLAGHGGACGYQIVFKGERFNQRDLNLWKRCCTSAVSSPMASYRYGRVSYGRCLGVASTQRLGGTLQSAPAFAWIPAWISRVWIRNYSAKASKIGSVAYASMGALPEVSMPNDRQQFVQLFWLHRFDEVVVEACSFGENPIVRLSIPG